MTKPGLKLKEYATFTMTDEQAKPEATLRALRAGLVAAHQKGDLVEAARIEKHLSHSGPTGLRYAHRPASADPIEQLITDRRLRRAAEALRRAAEGLSTGRYVPIQAIDMPVDPTPSRDDLLPPIRNAPTPPDPKNRWVKAKRTMRRTADGRDVKIDCPPTWPPKPVKDCKGMPRQFIAEAVFRALREHNGADRRKRVWREALDTFGTWEMREAIWCIIVERRSLTWACKHVGLPVNGRCKRIIKQNLAGSLDRVAIFLESDT